MIVKVIVIMRQLLDRQLKCKMAEGYKAVAEDNLGFTNRSSEIVNETLPNWD
jgi:hypothetical protein